MVSQPSLGVIRSWYIHQVPMLSLIWPATIESPLGSIMQYTLRWNMRAILRTCIHEGGSDDRIARRRCRGAAALFGTEVIYPEANFTELTRWNLYRVSSRRLRVEKASRRTTCSLRLVYPDWSTRFDYELGVHDTWSIWNSISLFVLWITKQRYIAKTNSYFQSTGTHNKRFVANRIIVNGEFTMIKMILFVHLKVHQN